MLLAYSFLTHFVLYLYLYSELYLSRLYYTMAMAIISQSVRYVKLGLFINLELTGIIVLGPDIQC
jgi:hypothetical protein